MGVPYLSVDFNVHFSSPRREIEEETQEGEEREREEEEEEEEEEDEKGGER
jgi:hypothetical protein